MGNRLLVCCYGYIVLLIWGEIYGYCRIKGLIICVEVIVYVFVFYFEWRIYVKVYFFFCLVDRGLVVE